MEKEKPIEKADMSKIHQPVLTELFNARVLTEEGLRVQGIGILIRKIEKLTEMVDKTNLKLYYLEKKLE